MNVDAAVAYLPGEPLRIASLALDAPRQGEVRVRMVASGICHTDALARDGVLLTSLPVVLGHEGSGVIDELGPGVTGLNVGDHVILAFDSCSSCSWCRLGHPADCVESGQRRWSARRADGSTSFHDGNSPIGSHFFGQSSFASYANVGVRTVVKVPRSVPLELLGPLACGFSTGAGTVLNVLKPGLNSSLLVFGAGAVGCGSLLAGLVAHCSTIIMVDIVDSRLARALDLGATHVINSSTQDPVEAIREITGGGAQYAVDATSSEVVFGQMMDSLAVRGFGARVGGAPGAMHGRLSLSSLLQKSQTVTGVRQGDIIPQLFIPHLLDLHEAGKFAFDRLIDTYAFSAINDAFDDAASGRSVKPVVLF